MSAEQKQKCDGPQLVFIGGYTQKLFHVDGQGKGITVCKFDNKKGETTIMYTEPVDVNPSFLFKDRNGPYLYATQENTKANCGRISSYKIDESTGKLDLLSVQKTNGTGPCYISMDPKGENLFVANYMSGDIVNFKVTDGALHPHSQLLSHSMLWKTATDEGRQESAHAHCADLHPSNNHLYSCDLGADALVAYTWENNELKYSNSTPSKAGAGPRHIEFSSDGDYLYVSNELNNTASVYKVEANGSIENIQTISLIEDGDKRFSNASHIKLHPNGQFLYAANRFTDTIAVFAVDASTGQLSKKKIFSCGGKTPRHFSFDPSGKWLLVANQDTSTLVTFEVNSADGSLTYSNTQGMPSPTAVCFF